ncbi:serine/threonine protein kinase [Ruminococcus sp. YE71]|uniref:Stk1 family PASTA domain-containing Ser/Thr kinase n=1 Tax=unclassified Ruminococcus TaxID=2608920 RepID=UPI000885E305|nr:MULTISPECIES: Stk1 family PASTA domain-containing Ser/Thr kinase [unclassified Ruminococcus]SDA20994.1 serine/threonine protein kinase [Ruminococcus sp. YE78]SFW33185.1 serine/threonine protein kinase [Ruminococcus sp. YE71]
MDYIGTRLDDRYEITEQIGSGGMADVYKANDLESDRIVAVKILKDEFSENADFLRRFRNESKAIAVLNHPNIVKIFDVGLEDDIKFIVMEYIDGITLKDFIEQQGVLRWKDALFFMTQILRALQSAHDKGIVHRDIKPQNIMMLEDGTIKVMDFGIARFSRTDGKTLSDKTVGSVHYISPEQARGEITDERSDIYSVGIMLYEMVTGKKPYDADTPVAIALKHMNDTCVPPREIMSTIPEALEEIIHHAMEKDPARRYQSAAQMINDIDTFKLDPTVVFGYTDPNFEPESDGDTRFYNPLADNSQDDYPEENYDEQYPEEYNDYGENDEEYYDDEYYEEAVPKRSYVLPIMFAVTVAVVVIASLVIAYYAIANFGPGATHSGSIEIPNFVGKNIVQVEQQYKDKLTFVKTEEYNNEYEEGIILSQEQTGKTVKEGYKLKVTVSKGQRLITIPNMVNKDAEIARSELASAGFIPLAREVYDDNIAKGTVVKTEPSAGTEYPEGKEVQYFVSQGPLETQVKVPNVIGLTQAKAIATLKESKLGYEIEEIKHDGDKGKVVEQSIKADTYQDKGTTVIIYISTGETDPIPLTMKIPMPQGIRGSYTIDVYRDGSVAYTKTINNGEAVAGGTVAIEIQGKKTETLVVYIKSNDLGAENYIRYATYDIDYDKEEIKLNGTLNESDLLKITPASTPADTSATEQSLPDPTIPDSSSEPTTSAPTESQPGTESTDSTDYGGF